MRNILEVLRLHHDEGNLSHREIAWAISASPTTVGEILCWAKLAQGSPAPRLVPGLVVDDEPPNSLNR
jgi:hypothetical protein